MKRKILIGLGLAMAALAALPYLVGGERLPLDDAARAGAPGKFLDLPAGKVHYELGGPPGAPLVVLVHGLSTPFYVWDELVPRLREGGFRTLRFDLYGRGFSDRPNLDYTGELFVQQLLGLLDALREPSPVTLAGISMGGGVVALAAARHPERVDRVVLMAPIGFMDPPAWSTRVLMTPLLGDYLASVAGDSYLVNSQRDNVAHPEAHTAFFARFADQMRYAGYKRALISSVRHLVYRDLAEEYRTLGRQGRPLLLLWGREDAVIPVTHAEQIRLAVPQAQIELLDDVGHLAPVEQPEQTARRMLAFLQEGRRG